MPGQRQVHSATITRLTGAQTASASIMSGGRLISSQSPSRRTYNRFALSDVSIDATASLIYFTSIEAMSRAAAPPAVAPRVAKEEAVAVKPAYLNVLAGAVVLTFVSSLLLLYVMPELAIAMGIVGFLGTRWVGSRSESWRKTHSRRAKS